ncbi:MAG: zinc ribbon domain-containing protein [Actinomycetota bacterium]|nr:zinc ribbon domain-containing protein [Actinomycetota bacterium]
MASYDYRCRSCSTVFEVRRPIDAATAPAVRCPDGHDDVARVWSASSLVGARPASAAPSTPAGGGGCCGGGCCG